MSKRWLGLLLLVWIGGRGIAHAQPQLTVTPSSPQPIDFGSVRVTDTATSATAATKAFTLANSGTGSTDLVVSAVDFSTNEYSILPAPPYTIRLGSNQVVTVTFNPSQTGARDATMTITSNDGTSTTDAVSLTGTGTAAVIAVTNVDFSDVPAGGSSSKNISVTNTGAPRGPLTVTRATLSPATPYSFGVGLGCNGGTDCTFAPALVIDSGTSFVPVLCAPPTAASGPQPGTVTLFSDSDSGNVVATLACNATHPNLTLSPSPLPAFPDTPVGSPATQTITLTNGGNAPLTYSVGPAPGSSPFIVDTCTNCTLAAMTSTMFNVTFTPIGPVTSNASFTITSNDPDLGDGSKSVALTGTGKQGLLTLSPTSRDFGGVALNTTKRLPFTLTNTGNVQITNLAAALTGDPDFGFAFDAPAPTTLDPGGQLSLSATFTPTTAGASAPASLNFSGHWSSGSVTGAPVAAQLPLTGNGQIAAYTVTPPSFAFPDFRFDEPPSTVITVTNTGQADLTIALPTIAAEPPTVASELKIEVHHGATLVTSSQKLTHNDQLLITVTLQPSARVGKVSGSLMIHPDIGPDASVALSGVATSAAIAVDAAVDFGPVDVLAPPPSRTLVVMNTGAATLDITSITAMAGGSPAFQVKLPAGLTQVAALQSFPLTVTYAPTVAAPASQPDQLVLTAALAGIAGGPNQATITITGRGVDRNLEIAALPTFPPTFRNPGDAAPVLPITIRNTGGAPLSISAVMATGDPVWRVVDASPVVIAPGDQHDFLVKFSPTAIGAAPTGQLVLTNDDRTQPMAIVMLTGTGVRRDVEFGAPAPVDPTDPDVRVVDLGEIGIGIPVDVTDALAVVNNDAATAFTIHGITLDGDPGFRIAAAPSDVALPATATRRFTITVVATAAGPLTTTASLYLDQDGVAQGEVQLTGNAVFVEAHGSGGCSAGGSDGRAGFALVVLAAVYLAVRRRRARRSATAAATLAIGLAIAPAARADGVDLAVFAPTPSTTGTGFQVQTPEVGADGSWVAGATVSFASNPLVLEGFDAQRRETIRNALVERSTLIEPGIAYAFLGRFEAGVHIPVYMQSGKRPGIDVQGMPEGLAVAPADGTATGNLTLNLKARLWRGAGGLGSFTFGAGGVLVLPTATQGQFTGSDKPEGRVLLLAAFTPAALASRLAISLNAGGILRSKSEYANIVEQSGVAWGAGASYRVLDELWATAELFGEATPSGRQTGAMAGASVLSPIEWLAGLTLKADPRFTVGIAAGRGVTDAIGTPDLRGVVSLAFVAGAQPIRALDPEAATRDRDGDGIPDAVDKCPDEPEDKDGFQDEDGCPDPDNDGDGIPDAVDKCPNEPEDKDGFEDLDGCPDPDNDHDGIPDAKDKCPNEPETINGFQDEDGCPDKGDTAIVLSPDRIETLDPIQFAGLKPTRASLSLLGQVAATLRAHPEILRLRVTVHVQPTGDDDADQTRSERRAQAVRDWLVQWGIAPGRVEQRGFGGAKPLVPAGQRGAAKINDRIELIILERK